MFSSRIFEEKYKKIKIQNKRERREKKNDREKKEIKNNFKINKFYLFIISNLFDLF